MAGMFIEQIKKNSVSIPALIIVTAALAVAINCYLLFFNRTVIFDPLFFIPIILLAYYYPQRGVSFAGAFAVLYLLMVMIVPSSTHETALASFGHAGIFIIIGAVISYLRLRYPREIISGASFRNICDLPSILFKKARPIAILIILTSILAIALNTYLLISSSNLIFDPLFYFPIILVAYFYPRYGVLATAGYAVVFCTMVMLAAGGSSTVVVTGVLHAGIFVIIGFLLSYIVLLYSHEQEIHKRLAEIVESSSDAIIGKTLDGIITDWNRGAERLYGYSAAEVTGKSVNLLVPPDRPDEIRTLLDTVRNGVAIERYETERVTKDNRRIWVSLAISPIRNDAGVVIGASVISYDITERRLAEDALTRANRTLQLFNSITRHDILNQLTVLNIYHNLTESMVEDPVALSFLGKAKKAAEAISRQIQFTQEYQEIGAKKPRWLNVYNSFTSAAAMFIARSVTITPCGKGIEIYADPLLEEVFYKLIDNSLTYGALVTTIRCTISEDENNLTILYEDNGIGVPKEDKQKIFNKAAGDDPRFGLFLIREILAITNITIMESGDPGKGARFEIRVPRGAYRSVKED